MADQHHHGHDHPDDSRLLDLEAEVLTDYWAQALDTVQRASSGVPIRRVLDLGAGTGAGSVGLARRLPGAEVLAIDSSSAALTRLSAHAAAAGVGERVTTICADLDSAWPDLGELDLSWASMSLHHLADPAAALARLIGSTTSGGLLAVAELREPLRFLPAEGPAAAAEEQLVTATGLSLTEVMPTLGSAWAPRLAAAGWGVVQEVTLPTTPAGPATPGAYLLAHSRLSRYLQHGRDRLDVGHAAVLEELLGSGPDGLRARSRVQVRGSRTVTIARRPGAPTKPI